MAGYKEPGFQDRVKAAADAKLKALERLKTKPPIDPAVQAERIEKARAREEAQIAKREAAKAAKAAAEAQKEADRLAAEEEARRNAPPPPKPALTEAERKALRDAKYAARKARRK